MKPFMETKKGPLPIQNVQVNDSFWSDYIELIRNVVVPYQWEALNDRVKGAEPSYAVRNFKIAAGEEQGDFGGMVFQDSDVAKWLEAVAYLLQTKPDAELEAVADQMIDIIAKAQHSDGYLNTYFTLKEPNGRWTNLAECHELYCAGHMIEAAVAYYQTTGKRKILDVACRFADYIDSVFGKEPGKLLGYDGHQEIELALVKLYHVTENERYLELSRFFLDQRGEKPYFYHEQFEQRGGTVHFPELDMSYDLKYSQSHLPVREQFEAVGHSVRLVYMLTAMADVAAETNDKSLLESCKRVWRNMVSQRMYITGAIGSMAEGESFTTDYDLPNDTAYAETCASIGLIFFAQRMLRIEPNSEYADVMEKALYNTVVSGMSRDGKSFFYVNPLEVQPSVCGSNHIYDHVKPVRQGWFGCACCPPNIARLLASLGQYIYTTSNETIYTHLYIGGNAEFEINSQKVTIDQHSNYGWDGKITFNVLAEKAAPFTLALRIPAWSDTVALKVNGASIAKEGLKIINGYMHLTITSSETEIEVEFGMPIRRMQGHPMIRHTAGKVALQRGPFIYCMEETDNGAELHRIYLPKDGQLQAKHQPELMGGLTTIEAAASRYDGNEWAASDLYRDSEQVNGYHEQFTATFIPYYAWANRTPGEMSVWVKSDL